MLSAKEIAGNWDAWSLEVAQDPDHESRVLLNNVTAEFLLRMPLSEPVDLAEDVTLVRDSQDFWLLSGHDGHLDRTQAVHAIAEVRNEDAGWEPDGEIVRSKRYP